MTPHNNGHHYPQVPAAQREKEISPDQAAEGQPEEEEPLEEPIQEMAAQYDRDELAKETFEVEAEAI